MSDPFRIGHLYPNVQGRSLPVQPAQPQAERTSFQNILDSKLLKFSQHAQLRLDQRGIELADHQIAKMEKAIDQAAAKGAKDTLLMMENLAFIVNVKHKTIVTAMDQGNMKDHVFTQIDSAIIVK